MTPRVADAAVGAALVEAGARLIAEREPLSSRRLASEVGVSTSAVYTHFGSMVELRRAIRRVGFERLEQHLTSYEKGDDPVADLVKQGWAYCLNAIANADMYRVMFMDAPLDQADAEVGLYTFQMLVDEVQRCIGAGRFEDKGAWEMATRVWVSVHGAVALHLAGILDEASVDSITRAVARALFISFGDIPEQVDDSLAKAEAWIAEH